jgi:hypothetical protein
MIPPGPDPTTIMSHCRSHQPELDEPKLEGVVSEFGLGKGDEIVVDITLWAWLIVEMMTIDKIRYGMANGKCIMSKVMRVQVKQPKRQTNRKRLGNNRAN